jgi:PAS domain S-box-containing protein
MEKLNLRNSVFGDITRILSAIVIIIGLVVIIGWLLDIDTLKSIVPTWVTMKFSTALSFLMSGIVVMLLNEWRNNNSEFSRIFLFVPLIIISFFMATGLVTSILDTTSGVSSLFVKDDPGSIGTLKAGLPSVGTMVSFLLIMGVGFVALLVGKFTERKFKKYAIVSGALVLVLGIIALLGYVTEEPALYYQVAGYSGAMAIHTAIAFCITGIGIMFFVMPKIIAKEVSKKKFALPISVKLVFYFLIAAIIPMMVVGGISFDLSQTSLEKETFESLHEQADINLDRLEGFFFERKADAEVTSKIKVLSNEVPTLKKYLNDQTNPEFIESTQNIDLRLKAIEEAYGYDSIALTDENGIFVYVTQDKAKFLIGTPLQVQDSLTYEQGMKRVYISHILEDLGADGLPELLVSAPIIDDEGSVVGVLVLDVPIQRLLTEAMELTFFGETGETLLISEIDGNLVHLHPVRFDKNIATLEAMTVEEGASGAARKSMLGMSGAGIATDYRNEEVLASWRYSPSLDWGLVSKIDTKEAFAPIKQLQQDIIILSLVFAGGIGIFGITAARAISDPLVKLKTLAAKISQGELDTRVPIQSSDEIGQLSEIMNDTVSKLKKEKKDKDNVLKALDVSAITAITDRKGDITYANKKFEEISKYNLDELLGKNHRLLKSEYHPDTFFDDLWGTISKGKIWYGIVKNKAKDGSFYWVNTVITPFLDDNGKPEQYMAIRMDMTKQKELEEKLEESLKQVEEAQKEKEEFVAMITHDLKQPLVPISGNAEILKNPKMGELNEMQRECVEEIQANASRQLSMIDNLVSAQKLGAGAMKYEIEEISSKEILAECIKTHAPAMTDKNLEYFESSTEDLIVRGDRRRIVESFTNLILNAHDFVPNDGKIEIGVINGEKEVTFFCKDNGEGIPKEKQDQLFKKYGQVKSDAKRKFGGTGLGLAVSQELVEGMGGRIWLESEEGKGATFFFTIPKA